MNACVIGAGTMGAGIAAHLANLGFTVSLLDVTRESAQECLERAKKVRPPHFYNADAIAQIRTGGIDLDLDWVREADWVCEAIIERIDAKRELYERIAPMLKSDAMMTTNTSSLPLHQLVEGMPQHFRERFVGTHFFNPPRYLKLLELIPGPDTTPENMSRIGEFLEREVARRVVVAKDTPGFIANRFGMWSMFHAIHVAEKLSLSIEQVDLICGPFLGRPRSAAFRLNDLVGLDVMAFIAGIMKERCPDDPYRESLSHPRSLDFLIEKGWVGQKAGKGYYRKEGKELLVFDLTTHAYRNQNEISVASVAENAKLPFGERIRKTLQARDEAGEFLRHHLLPVLQYANYLKEEISHCVEDFDRVMMWGFGWEMGPFAMIDAIGAEPLEINEGAFYRDQEQRDYSGNWISRKVEPQYRPITDYPVIDEGEGFVIRDVEEGVKAISLNSKMGVIGPKMVESLTSWLESQQGPLILTSEAKSFSAGFDLKFLLERIDDKDWTTIDESLNQLQRLTVMLSERKVVSAVYGHCLGAGFELASACPIMASLSETQIGLPEAKVGLIPGGAGTCRMRLRYQNGAPDMVDGAIMLMLGKVATSAGEAKTLRYLRRNDVIIHHPDRLIADARELAKQVEVKPQQVWLSVEGPVNGMIDRRQDECKAKGEATEHDELVGDRIKAVFTKVTSFDEALTKERSEFIELCKNALSLARVRHMAETNKPLRN